MAEYIDCRDCTSPDCKGCNLKNLETMLKSGKFDRLMNGNRCISVDSDVAPVRHGQWILGTGENALQKGYRMCSQCGEIIKFAYTFYGEHNFCNYCGAKMHGVIDEE